VRGVVLLVEGGGVRESNTERETVMTRDERVSASANLLSVERCSRVLDIWDEEKRRCGTLLFNRQYSNSLELTVPDDRSHCHTPTVNHHFCCQVCGLPCVGRDAISVLPGGLFEDVE